MKSPAGKSDFLISHAICRHYLLFFASYEKEKKKIPSLKDSLNFFILNIKLAGKITNPSSPEIPPSGSNLEFLLVLLPPLPLSLMFTVQIETVKNPCSFYNNFFA